MNWPARASAGAALPAISRRVMPPPSAGQRNRESSGPGFGCPLPMPRWPTARPVTAKKSMARTWLAGTRERRSSRRRWRWRSGCGRRGPISSTPSCSGTTSARGWWAPAAGSSSPSSVTTSTPISSMRSGRRWLPHGSWASTPHGTAMPWPSSRFRPTGWAPSSMSAGTSASRFRRANTPSRA